MSFALNVIAKSTIILLCTAVLALLLRRASASMRHAVWVLAIASVLLLPLALVIVPQFEWSALPQASTSVTFLAIQNLAGAAASAKLGLKSSTTYLSAGVAAALAWVFGVTFLSTRLVIGTVHVRRMAKTAAADRGDSWCELMKELSLTFRIRTSIRLLFSNEHVSPMTWGVLRHTILLPSAAREWSEKRRRLVLAHELAHVKRNDGLMQVFIQIVCSLHWFNPLVWYAAHRVRIERERACDDHVLTLGATATDYADHLVQIVRGLRASRSLSFAAVSMAQSTQLETRLISILDSGVRRRTLSTPGTILLCMFASLLTTSIAAIRVTAAVPLPPVFVAATKIAPPAPAPKAAPQPAAAPQRTRIGNGDAAPNNAIVPPRVVESKPPIYTDEALKAHIEGTVTVEAAVDLEGKIKILRVVKRLGYGLDERAIGAVLDWKFAPATRNGAPVEAITQVDVDFKIPASFNETITIGPGVTPPTIISRVEPQYTDEARDARYQGTVVVSATIEKDGTLKVDKVLRELDYGLTAKAVEALQQWKFKPGMRNGEAVAVSLKIEVNFNLR